jgi:hypothetical protein
VRTRGQTGGGAAEEEIEAKAGSTGQIGACRRGVMSTERVGWAASWRAARLGTRALCRAKLGEMWEEKKAGQRSEATAAI